MDQEDDERLCKRRWGEDRQIVVEESNDYFNDVLGHGRIALPVLDSWLKAIQWIGVGHIDKYSPRTDPMAIETLSKQLIQVKRRMRPAMDRCALCAPAVSSPQIFADARAACNPYEALGEGRKGRLNSLFMNRSAIKLVNMDAILGFCLTRKTNKEPFVFVDLCGAPGGFSEYILSRCLAQNIPFCKGFGMSLTGENEYGEGIPWKLKDITVCEGSRRVEYKVCPGWDGSGDVMDWKNVCALQSMIVCPESRKSHSETEKVDLVVADGGMNAQRDSEDQEGITQKLVVCEVAAALDILKKGGMFVIKLFGFQSSIIRSVLIYLFSVFENLIALKPITSRPASAERYVICTGFEGHNAGWSALHWRNEAFMGCLGDWARRNLTSIGNADELLSACNGYLNDFDHDLLVLNLKACHAILSFLSAKVRNGGGCDMLQHSTEARIDFEEYRKRWQLDGASLRNR